MQLTERQKEIIEIVKANSPITSLHISEKLNLSMPTIRGDLRLLTAFGLLEARPKVGYSYVETVKTDVNFDKLFEASIKDIIQEPTIITEATSLQEAVNTLFIDDVGSLYVVDNEQSLVGVLSRKDLLRASINNQNTQSTLAGTIMTRMPNIITVTEDESIINAGKMLLQREIDSLPVVDNHITNHVVGKITKNRIFRHFIELGMGKK